MAKQQGCEEEELWERLERISALTIAALHRVHTDPPAPSFHILGLDVMLDARGEAHLLEVNNSPSLCINSPLPLDGSAAAPPEVVEGRKRCRCMAHHRDHVHVPCQVDIAAKSTVVADTLRVARRMRRAGAVLPTELADEDFGSLRPIGLGDAEAEVLALVPAPPLPTSAAAPPSVAVAAAAAAAARRAAGCRAASAAAAAGAGVAAARSISGQRADSVRWVR